MRVEMADEPPENVTATAQLKLSPAQLKLLLHLQMVQRQAGEGTTQIVLNVSRGRIELIDARPLKRIVFA